MKKYLYLLIIPALFLVSCGNGGTSSSVEVSSENISVVEPSSSEILSENEIFSSEEIQVSEDVVFSSEEANVSEDVTISSEEVASSENVLSSEESVVSSEEVESEEIKSEEMSSEEISSEENNGGIIYDDNCSDSIYWGNLT